MLTYETRPLQDHSWLRYEANRIASRFTASWRDTMTLLERELEHLDATDLVLEVDVRSDQLRRDGMVKANARAASPAVVLFFESKHGPLRYECDTYGTLPWRPKMDQLWQHNLRAIAMTLEAQRAVERHGAAKSGQAYTGWAALNAGPSANPDTAAAAEYIRAFAEAGADLQTAWSQAKRRTHPDAPTGTPHAWERVQAAGQILGLK